MKITRKVLAIVVAALFSLAALAQQKQIVMPKEHPVPPDSAPAKTPGQIEKKDVPGPVMAAFNKAYPKAEFKSCAKEETGGKTCYRIKCEENLVTHNVLYAADGTTMEIRDSVIPLDLPAPIKSYIDKNYPKCAISRCELVTKGPKVYYDMTVNSLGKISTFSLDAQGNAVK